MSRYFFLLLIIIITFISCARDVQKVDRGSSFPVLTYNAEISETLNLDLTNIYIDNTRNINFWSQHFQNPKNNLNNILTNASFEKKTKLISGKRGVKNIIQPIFFDNNICHVLNTGFIECVNVETENTNYKIDIKLEGVKKYELVRGGLAYFENKIVFVDGYGQINLYNATNGEEIWKNKIDFPILSPPLIYRGYIYFISSDNRIFSADIIDGTIAWSFQTISENKKNLFTSSPVAYENTIIVPFSNGDLVSFIYDTGRPIWSENVSKISLVSNFDIKDISASPVISGNNIYSLSSNGKFVSLNAMNGQRNWSIDLSGFRTPIISGNQIYVINDEAKLICIDINTGEIYWIVDLSKYSKGQKSKNMNLWLGPYLINNLLYNLSYFGELKIVSPISGDILSKKEIGVKGIMSPPLILTSSIFITDENSNVFKFK